MEKSTGAFKSKYDVRTFTYLPTKAGYIEKGGEKYKPEDIEDQYNVGICTAISLTQKARKHYGVDFSDDFQYLLQKKFVDGNWIEGSSAFSACKVGNKYGFLPQSEWTHTTIEDRKLAYGDYIKKLQAIPDSEIQRLIGLASKYKIKAYAKTPTIDRDVLANAINNSTGGIIARFVIGSEWWTPPIEPLRLPQNPISGHLVSITNFDGNSFRLANTWGPEWADGGTAYFLHRNYQPTEAWEVWFEEVPKEIEKQIESRDAIIGKILDLLQQIIVLITKLRVS